MGAGTTAGQYLYRGDIPHKTKTTLTVPAGEHLALSRPHQRGVMAAPAPRETPKVDILANFLEDHQPALLRGKARQYGSDGASDWCEKATPVGGVVSPRSV